MSLLERLRHHTARDDALLALSIVGSIAGILAGAVTVLFRLSIESVQISLLDDPEAYESLGWELRVLLPTLGGLCVGLLFSFAATGSRQVGITHVMRSMIVRAGRLPLRNALLQFIGGVVSIASGNSVGREGPAVHLGAAASSLLGQGLRLPNNCMRSLIACGTAASIAASFNTPIAGVIFAMEVVLMEYTVAGFTPVILAAVAGTWTSQLVYGAAPAFDLPPLRLTSLWELPYILFIGIVIGSVASLFNRFIDTVDGRMRNIRLWVRVAIAGLITGCLGVFVPEVMGIGYDTVELALVGEATLWLLLVVAVAKFFATGTAIALGVPAGIIGPTLVMGACVGGALGIVGHEFAPASSADAGLYAVIGMGAMMGAVLQAPLAALMAVLELTVNPHILLPGMIAVVGASLTSRALFRTDSVFISMLRARGVHYVNDPVAVSLQRIGVTAVMSRRFVHAGRSATPGELRELLERAPQWLVVGTAEAVEALVTAETVEALLRKRGEAGEEGEEATDEQPVDLLSSALKPQPLVSVRLQSTLAEALARLDESAAQALVVTRSAALDRRSVDGILTRADIEASVRFGSSRAGG